jgi:hypothetical protein
MLLEIDEFYSDVRKYFVPARSSQEFIAGFDILADFSETVY